MAKNSLSLDGIVVDIGNSDYKVAFVSQGEIHSIHRTKSCPNLIKYDVPIIACSVVPRRTARLQNKVLIHWITHADLPILSPTNVGVDRLVALYAAKTLYKAETVLVIDVGTFMTLSVLHQNEFMGGYIVPGPHTMMASYDLGAQLVKNQNWTPNKTGTRPKDTVTAMQAGTTEILQRGLTSLIGEIKLQYPHILVVGTGGAAIDLLSPIADVAIINPTLILEGLGRLAKAKQLV